MHERRAATPDLRPRLVRPLVLTQLHPDGTSTVLTPAQVGAWLRQEAHP